ncbi:N-acetylmuramoyl-L-alanine amidase [Syntrophomonas curvata]
MLKPKAAFKRLTTPNPADYRKRTIRLPLLVVLLSTFFFSFLLSASAATGIINTDNVNIRSGPATTYDALGRLSQGSQVEILSSKNDWYQIQSTGLNGWIRNDLINVQKEYFLKVTGNGVNLRSGPGTGFDVVGSASQGEILTLLDVKGEWYQVKTVAGLQAYIKASFTQKTEKPVPGNNTGPVPPPAAASGKQVEVTSGTVFLRSGPGSSYDKTGSVSGGDILLVLGQEGDWYKIKKADGSSAYVAGWLVQPANAAAPTTPATPNNNTGVPAVILDGRQLTFEVSPIIENDRTLVPLRAIFEAMGASVDWDNKTRTVTSVKDGTTVILAIGSTRPTVNGQAWPLDVPAKIKNDRTLAPLRFVGEAFGGKVDWNNTTRTITITSPPAPSPAEPEEPKPEPKPENPGPGAIWLSLNTDENGIQIRMDSGAKLDADIKEDSGKVTYEFKDRQIEGLNLVKQSLGAGEAKAKARNVGGNTIVEIEFPYSTQYQTASEEGGKREVFIIPNSIRAIEQKGIGSSGERLVISTLTPAKYSSSKNGDIIEIKLPGVLKGKVQKEYQYNNSLMKTVAIEETTGTNSATIIKIATTGEVAKYIVGQSTDGRDINILMVGKSQIKSRRDNLVVLDPGHGGKDPGSSGADIKEKDINLKVALKAGELLKQRGIEVEYTRDTDIYLELTETRDEISEIANRLNPALFVSIHVNAALNSSAQGTETYYYAPVDNDLLFLQQDERKSLAENLQRQLIAKLKRPNRGVKTKNLAVLRNTTMPSALVELAFISNPEEERLLQQEYFINLAAEAVAEGVAAYMGK